MGIQFFRIWLPLSLAVHVVLALLVSVLPAPAREADLTATTLVRVVEAPPPPSPPPDVPVRAVPPPTRKVPRITRAGQPKITHPPGTARMDGNATRPVEKPGGGNAPEPARSEEPTAPPDIMKSGDIGDWEAPPGLDGGTGTQGTSLEPSGPSYGVAAQGNPAPGYPKLALEEGLSGIVEVLVAVDARGKIEDVRIAKPCPHDVLNNAAIRGARMWSFAPAMEKGKPVGGTVTIRFRFADGKVEGKAL